MSHTSVVTHPLRAYARSQFAELLQQPLESGMVLNAEKGVLNVTIKDCEKLYGYAHCGWVDSKFRNAYKCKLQSLLFNLKNPKNPDFLVRVRAKEIECRALSFLSAEEMFPAGWADLKAKLAKHQFYPVDLIEDVPDSPLYKCKKCKLKKINTYQAQIRSADEGMTTYHRCINCLHCWKE
jgi:DNA-directed RNA polymerase subunit M/transcription elongation factor TFIIS